MVRRKFLEVKGAVGNLGSKEKNIASARRKIRVRGFKGKFQIKISKTPKSKFVFVKFKGTRK